MENNQEPKQDQQERGETILLDKEEYLDLLMEMQETM